MLTKERKTPVKELKDPLAIQACKLKTLSDGITKVTHIGAWLPSSIDIDSGVFTMYDGIEHKIDNFDWHDGRVQI